MKSIRSLVLLIAAAALSCSVAQAACYAAPAGTPTAVLTFTAPTTNTDGTPIATPLTYTVYQGLTATSLASVATGLTGSPISVTTGLTDNQTYYFALTVTDANGSVSAQSASACITFQKGVPNTVTITIT